MADKQTTKKCPKCGNTHLALLTTLNKKHCSDCGLFFDWKLGPKQKPVYS